MFNFTDKKGKINNKTLIRSYDIINMAKFLRSVWSRLKQLFGQSNNSQPNFRKNMDLELDYKMDHSIRGKAIIFNHYIFKVPNMRKREGTHIDEKRFYQVLQNWGFQEVDILPDFTLKEIKDYLYNMSKIDYSDYDVFLCAIFTHGERNALYSFDTLFATSKLWQYFTDEECPSLQNKPKLFFIQACRGDQWDSGLVVRDPDPKNTATNSKTTIKNNFEDDVNGIDFNSSPNIITSKITSDDVFALETVRGNENVCCATPHNSNWSVHEFNESVDSKGSIHKIPLWWKEGRSDVILNRNDKSLNQKYRLASEETQPSTSFSFGRQKSHSVPVMPDDWKQTRNDIYDSKLFYEEAPFQVPHSDPDILVAYSTVDKFYSFRNPSSGSWFISTLHKVVTSKTINDEMDLMQLLTEVNLRVAVDLESMVNGSMLDKMKQISCFHSTLTKRVCFKKQVVNS